MSHTRTSTVPKLWCGRTSHQISRIVLMKPVSIMWFTSHTYSLQLRISVGSPAVGRPSITFERCECRPVCAAFPKRAADAQRQQRRQMPHDAVANHHRLVARIDADVHVQAERHQPPGHFLQQIHELQIAIVRRDPLVLPLRKRMRRPPPQPQPERIARRLDDRNLVRADRAPRRRSSRRRPC